MGFYNLSSVMDFVSRSGNSVIVIVSLFTDTQQQKTVKEMETSCNNLFISSVTFYLCSRLALAGDQLDLQLRNVPIICDSPADGQAVSQRSEWVRFPSPISRPPRWESDNNWSLCSDLKWLSPGPRLSNFSSKSRCSNFHTWLVTNAIQAVD